MNQRFRFGDWQVDPASNTLTRGTAQHQIEPRVMDVLTALCRRANTVVSAEELLVECWGHAVFGDNPVHKAIAQLRRVLGDNASLPLYIETIRKRGYRTVSAVVLADGSTQGETGLAWNQGSPFRGLEAFDEAHAAVFFGRGDATQTLLRQLAAQSRAGRAFCLILGASGCGKSSLVHAGVFPALMRGEGHDGLRVLDTTRFNPGEIGERDILAALGDALLDWQIADRDIFPGANGESLGQRLEQSFDSVVAELRWAMESVRPHSSMSGISPRMAIFIDQFESIFTSHLAPHQPDEARRLAFLTVLDNLARCPYVLVIAACRNDFYPRLAEYPMLMEGKASGGHFDLSPPTEAEITQIIRRPAAAAQLSFGVDPQTGTRLDDLLCDVTSGSPDALPLLQYTLQELYRLRTPQGELSFEAFHHLGGLEGAIGRRAEEVINALDEPGRASLPRILSLVVTLSSDEEAVTGRRAPWSALTATAERELVQALVEARLFVSELVGNEPGFGVAHEALLRRWPRVTEWIEAHRSALRTRGRIASLASRWVTEARSADLLIPGGRQLDEADLLLTLPGFTLSPDEIALIRTSASKARWRERMRIATLSAIVLLAGLVGLLGLSALNAKSVAQKRRVEAEGLMGFMLGDFADKLRPLGRLDLLDSVGDKAMQYLADTADEDANPVAVSQRAKALEVIGEVRIARGDPVAANNALLTASAALEKQLKLTPDDAGVLATYGTVSFWLGNIRISQNDWPGAEQALNQYRDSSEKLVALHPDDVSWQVELSYAHNSLGSLAMKRSDLATAAREFQMSVDLKTRAIEKKPHDATLAADLADSLTWIASVKENQGELAAADALYQRELKVVEALHNDVPGDAVWTHRFAITIVHQAELQRARGADDAAEKGFEQARTMLATVVKQEPGNRLWQRDLVYAELGAQPIPVKPAEAAPVVAPLLTLATTMDDMTKLDPKRVDWARLSAKIHTRAALALHRSGRSAEAGAHIAAAEHTLRGLHERNAADPRNRTQLADTLLTEAETATPDAATHACREALDLLAGLVHGSRDFRVLAPWVRANACLGQINAALEARNSLEQMGYRDADYLRFLSSHQ